MPWTPKQKRYLLSSGSPLSAGQKEKMKGELHRDPSLGHAKKGYKDPRHSHPFSLDPDRRTCLICGKGRKEHKIV